MKMNVSLSLLFFIVSSCFNSAFISKSDAKNQSLSISSDHQYKDVDYEIVISDTVYQLLPHFKIKTPSATYLISKESGGCSSMLDMDGNDWIKNSRTGNNPPYNSSDSDYRGMPNLVFQGKDDGVGHPSGLNKCKTIQLSYNKLSVKSLSGKWEFSYTFLADHVVLEVEKTDPDRNYWFLYEGPVAENFNPQTHYWVTDTDGIRKDMPLNGGKAAIGNWQWVCFGDKNVNRCFFVSMTKKDNEMDYFGYMGNLKNAGLDSPDGMNVFGFGRSGAKPMLKDKSIFIFGFFEENLENDNSDLNFKKYICKLIGSYSR